MTADELKRVPPVVNLHPPLQVPRQKQQHKTPTEPPDAADLISAIEAANPAFDTRPMRVSGQKRRQ
jgi:hypothetical protein